MLRAIKTFDMFSFRFDVWGTSASATLWQWWAKFLSLRNFLWEKFPLDECFCAFWVVYRILWPWLSLTWWFLWKYFSHKVVLLAITPFVDLSKEWRILDDNIHGWFGDDFMNCFTAISEHSKRRFKLFLRSEALDDGRLHASHHNL